MTVLNRNYIPVDVASVLFLTAFNPLIPPPSRVNTVGKKKASSERLKQTQADCTAVNIIYSL